MLSGSNVRGAGTTSSVLNPVDAPSSSPDHVFQLGGADLAIKRDAKYHVARELRRRELIDTERRYLLDGPNDPIGLFRGALLPSVRVVDVVRIGRLPKCVEQPGGGCQVARG